MKSLFLILTFFLAACSVSEDNSSSPIESFTEFDSESLSQSSTEINGTGRLIADSIFKSTRVNAHFNVGGQFFVDDSFFILHLFFDSFTQDTGFQLRFSISEEEHEDIQVDFAEPSRPFRPLTVIKKAVAEDHTFKLRIETQNQMNNQRRILIWNDSVFYDSGIRVPKDTIIAGNSDYDSLRNRDVFYTWGAGIHWGVTLERVKLNTLRREPTYVRP